MVEKLREVAGKDWAKSFVNSVTTILLGLLVAWITGFIEMKSTVATLGVVTQEHTAKLTTIDKKIDERSKEFASLQLGGSLADADLGGRLNVIKTQHDTMIRDLEQLRSAVERRK